MIFSWQLSMGATFPMSTHETAITLRYFAWVREKTGLAEERITPPADVRTITDLIAWLGTRGPGFDDAFRRPAVIRAAIDQRHVKPDAAIAGAREIAFFPPVTGG
jgi:molybdopterin synthase sulfur carrier subunit